MIKFPSFWNVSGSGWQKLLEKIQEKSSASKEEVAGWLKDLLHNANQIGKV